MGVVDGTSPAPPELQLGWACQRFGCLPDAGGYMDQDYKLITSMSALMSIHNAYSHYRNSAGTDIHGLSVSERRILKLLIDMRLMGV